MLTLKGMMHVPEPSMSSLTISQIDETLESALKRRAAQDGVSVEEEARRLLRRAVLEEETPGLGRRIAQRFHDLGVDDLPIPPRTAPRPPPFHDETA
jgi:plasmid stability protein